MDIKLLFIRTMIKNTKIILFIINQIIHPNSNDVNFNCMILKHFY